MKDNWFEDKMSERFEDFNSSLDLQSAWEELESLREPTKRKRRGGIYWWFGAGLILMFSAITFVFNSKEDFLIQKSESTPLSVSESENDKKTNEIKGIKNQVNPEKIVSPNNRINFNDQNYNRKKTLEKLNKNTKMLESKSDISTKDQRKSASLTHSNASLGKELKKSKVTIDDKKISNKILPTLPIDLLQNDIHYLPKINLREKNIYCDFKGPKKYSYSLGFTIDYGKTFRSSPIGLGSNNAFLQKRELAETPLDSWSGQAFYQIKNKKNWFGQFNLGYIQSTDIFEDTYSNAERILKPDQVIQINMYPNGDIEEITGPAMVNEEENGIGKFYQRYRQVFVGLEFGKEFPLNSDFNFRASLGGDYSIYHNNSGKVYRSIENSFGEYDDLSSISTNKAGIFSTKINLEIGKSFGFKNEISIGLIGKTNLNIIENDIGKRQYLLTELSYRKNF